MDTKLTPSPLASLVIERFEVKQEPSFERKITVNPFVSKMASAYEKLRNAMEYREDEVILRATIERILRRHLLLGGTAKSTAEPLIRELIWARYLQDNTVPESSIAKVEEVIDLYLRLRMNVLQQHKISIGVLNEWIYHLMSSAIENVLNPNTEKQTIANFMYQVLKDDVTIVDDTEETRNAQVYLAVRRAFARDDIAFLRYNLFLLYFGEVNQQNIEQIAKDFPQAYKEITKQLAYPKRDKIYSYIKKRAAAFFILEDILKNNVGNLDSIFESEENLRKAVQDACEVRYKSIASKVRRAIVRSVLFILLTKVIFAFAVEGTFERIVYGYVLWNSLIINTSIPPLLMIIVSLLIRPPGEENTKRIFEYIKILLFAEKPRLGAPLLVKKEQEKPHIIFNLLWLSAFLISFGAIIFVLSKLQFTLISQAVFIFFLTIVSFLAYRISLTANLFRVGEKQDVLTPFIDFLFMPVIRVGRRLTQSISQINFFLFLFDFMIETPFKVFFAFVEQWFKFLHEKTEDLG
ncbi:MAG: hypothetical protein KatS3mg089_0953 [Patescibacteria group bacterium]|nr:MAG: hypothetical protein KatS3mg089_0953 [Patescibacteria group bacterium]